MKKRKIKKKALFSLIIIGLFVGLLFFSGIKIINYLKDNHNNQIIQEKLLENVSITTTLESEKVLYNIDFASLKEKNEDTMAYLKVNGTNIDYVVVQGNDNSYYLNHNFNKEWNVSGWVFADYHNNFNILDKNIVIYAHNTRDGSMFGTLKNTLNSEWQNNKDNLKIVLVTEKKTYYYQVFSTYTVEPEDYYIKTDFVEDEDFNNFIQKVKSRSNNDYQVDISKDDYILTLSSCTSNGTKRVVLHAKLMGN